MKYTIKAPRQLNASINLPASKSISNRALVINAMAGCKLQPRNRNKKKMKYTIKAPRQLNASINLPASKSISNRALVINAMAGCKLQPRNLNKKKMKYTIKAPRQLNASINLPASKSISNRALVINAMAGCKLQPRNLSDCDDTEVIIAALRDMPDVINIKAAGTAMRFMTAYLSATPGEHTILSATPGEHTITGTERMQNRPIAILVDALRYLGADIQYEKKEGYPPLQIVGKPLEGGHLEVVGNISSQYISALLMIGPILKNGLELKLTGEIASRPYIDLTLWTMQNFGACAEWTDVDTITVTLRYLGADIQYEKKEGYPPLHIVGKPLEGGHLEVVGNISSQYISALLLIGHILKNGLELKLTGEIASRPYIDLTLWTMQNFGACAEWTDVDTITVKPQPYSCVADYTIENDWSASSYWYEMMALNDYTIENDWSASSYWYEMMALNGNPDSEVRLEGLFDNSKQGDSVVKYIFSLLGVKSEFENRDVLSPVKLKVQRCLLPRFDYDFSGLSLASFRLRFQRFSRPSTDHRCSLLCPGRKV